MKNDQQRHTESPARASKYTSINAAINTATDGTGSSFDFFSTVIAGLLIGISVDWMAGTRPVVTIIGIVFGFVVGFYKLWAASAILEEQAERRRR